MLQRTYFTTNGVGVRTLLQVAAVGCGPRRLHRVSIGGIRQLYMCSVSLPSIESTAIDIGHFELRFHENRRYFYIADFDKREYGYDSAY